MLLGFALLLLPAFAWAQTAVITLPVSSCSNSTITEQINVAFGNAAGTSRVIQEPTSCSYIHVCCDDNEAAFKFRLHEIDNDPETEDPDRQRLEMYLHNDGKEEAKGRMGDTMKYSWRFKLEIIEVSNKFYHIFQLKTQDSPPIMTLTLTETQQFHARLRVGSESFGDQIDITSVANILNKWITMSVKVVIESESNGGEVTITATSDSGDTWGPFTKHRTMFESSWGEFIRPKWGLYRDKTGTPTATRTHVQLFKDFKIYRY